MFRFIREHSYEIVRLFLTQVAIAVLGLVLSFSTSSSNMLFLVSSIFASVFYVCLLYSEGWELGAKDRPRITNNRMRFDKIKGVRLSLLSNVPNFIMVLLLFISFFLGSRSGAGIELFGSIYAIDLYIQRTISAMYMGINTYFAPYEIREGIKYIASDTIYQPLFYTISIIPSVCAVGLGYYMGANDRKLMTVNKTDA
ncbi:MAG: hypothetical protein IJE84_03405 [Clostridia bacterium]|nr:hypothetical protein [Clostridia bacterium]